jgi:PEP-CTERM motif
MNPNPVFLGKKSGFAVLAVALALTLFGTPQAKADNLSVTCSFPGVSVTTDTSLGVSVPCAGQTVRGAIYSGSGTIAQGVDGITMGSQLTWNGYGPDGAITTELSLSGTVEGISSGSPFALTTTFAGDGTHGTGPYGGTFSYSFDSGSTLFAVGYSSSLTINGTAVIPSDAPTAVTYVCTPTWAPNSAYPCSQIASSGSGLVSTAPRSGTYETTVGSVINFDAVYSNTMNFGTPASGTLSFNFDPGLTFSATDPTTGIPISGLSLVLSDGMVIPINAPNTAPVPEPSSLMLLGMGALGLFGPVRQLLLHRKS